MLVASSELVRLLIIHSVHDEAQSEKKKFVQMFWWQIFMKRHLVELFFKKIFFTTE